MNNKNKAIFYILISGLFFALMGFFVSLSGDLPVFQKTFFRNLIAALIALPIFLREHNSLNIGKKNWRDLFLRSVCGTIGMFLNFYALSHIHLSDANLLNKLSPFFAILSSIVILKEFPSRRDIAILCIAFAGAILVIKPTATGQLQYTLSGALSGAFAGCAYTYVRKLGNNGVPKSMIVLGFSSFSCITSLIFSIPYGFHMSSLQIFYLFLAGCAAGVAQFAITTAYTLAPARSISVFQFAQIIFSAILGFMFLNQIPDVFSILGYVIIIGCAIMNSKK